MPPASPLQFRTISPIELAPLLKTGVSHSSPGFEDLQQELAQLDAGMRVYPRPQATQYEELNRDVSDMRVCSWSCNGAQGVVDIHLYQSSVAVAEVALTLTLDAADALETRVQAATQQAILEVYPRFYALLMRLVARSTNPVLNAPRLRAAPKNARILWSARMLLLRRDTLDQPALQSLLYDWTKDTGCPEDAQAIIDGQRDYAMTWLNYVIVDPEDDDYRLETMVLAQYYYAAQEIRNRELKQAISAAYAEKQLKVVEQLLSRTRVEARLHQIQYHEHLKLLTRPKRRLLREILQGWEFPVLVENSERMIEVCSSRLEEADHKRRERSTVLTDLLLVTLSFFAVFELCLYLVEFSREMMSRPALDYTDDSTSFFLSTIAAIDTDVMFGVGVGLTFLLVLVYKVIKDN